MKAICLDAEMADRGELLELSIFDHTETEIYHQLFKPKRQKTWRTDIHHITPEMVADAPHASACAPQIAAIVKSADVIIGCAIDNDLRALSDVGINTADRQSVVDIQLLHFYLSGGRAGTLFNSMSLLALAEEYGVDFSEEVAHGASADTDATLRCFFAIMDKAVEGDSRADTDKTLSLSADIMSRAVAELAKGYLVLQKLDKGYRVESRYMPPKEKDTTVAILPVDDRHIAEYEIKKLFSRRTIPGMPGTYALRSSDLKAFSSYKCEHNPMRSAMCRALLKSGF